MILALIINVPVWNMDVEDRHTLGTFTFPLFKLRYIFYAIIKKIQNIQFKKIIFLGNSFSPSVINFVHKETLVPVAGLLN
jgi:hypothetical protein